MTSYKTYERPAPQRRQEPHPIWRGIGCMIMLLIPIMSFGISTILIPLLPTLGFQLPAELLGRPYIPEVLFQIPLLTGFLTWIQGIDNLYAVLIGTLTITILLTGIFSLGYAFVYRIIGPPRYTELDAPDFNIKVKKYKR